MNLFITKVSSPEDIQKCFAIRTQVFVEGQNVPIEEEVDGHDENSEHYLLLVDEQPVAAARVRFMEEEAKIERVAVLQEHQGRGYGKLIMTRILFDLKHHEIIKKAKLSSQVHAIPFYEKLGFIICSEEYMDAGIPHKDMKMRLV